MTTPNYAVQSVTSLAQDTALNSFTGTHTETDIYNGALAVQIAAYLGNKGGLAPSVGAAGFQALSQPGILLAQEFTMSGTAITRVEVPISILNGVGQDVTVQLMNSSGGLPTSVIASAVLPRDWQKVAALGALSSTPGAAMRAHQTALLTPWTANSTTQLPAPSSVASSPWGAQMCALGNFVISVNGDISGAFINNVWYAAYAGNGSLGAWQVGPSYPVAMWQLGLCSTPTGYIVGAGGGTGSTNTPNPIANVYTASFSQAGSMGSWTQQASIPQALQGISMTSATAPDGNTYVYGVGGTNSGGSVNSNAYVGQINNGVISGWATYPLPFSPAGGSVNCTNINGYLVVAYGMQGGSALPPVWAAKILSGGKLGPWFTGIPNANGFFFSSGEAMCSAGDYWVVCTNDSPNDVYVGVMTSKGDISQQNPPNLNGGSTLNSTTAGILNMVSFSNGDGSYEIIAFPYGNGAGGIGWTSRLQAVPMLSVPLNVTGLTNGGLYFISVQAPAAYDKINLSQAHVGTLSSAVPLRYSTTSGGSWSTAASGVAMPINVYNGSTGPLTHTYQDSGGKLTWYQWYEAMSSLCTVGEQVSGLLSNMSLLNYDSNNVLTSVSSLG